MWYYSLNDFLQREYGEKVYKLALSGSTTCPNRDGTIGRRGCCFCSSGGSGEFAASSHLSPTQQIEEAKRRIHKGNPRHFIAYFQSFTNTYGPVEKLRARFQEAISHPDVVGLSIATRPDCLPTEVLALLEELQAKKPVWVELGLQTIHPATATYIRRGYPLSCYEEAVAALQALHIHTVTHVILGLPGESREQMLETVQYVGKSGVQGIKLQLLHVLKGTDLAEDYQAGRVDILSQEDYIELLLDALELLPPNIVIHRLTGDGPKSLLLAPQWSADKKKVLQAIREAMLARNLMQGSRYQTPSTK